MIDERISFGLLLGAGAALACLLGFGTWAALEWSDDLGFARNQAAKTKVFKRQLMEDLRVTRHGIIGVDLIKCRSCRLEKRKKGPFTFGAINVLVLEDLEVVLVRDSDPKADSPKADSPDVDDSRAVVRRLGISDGFLAKRGLPFKFSGVRISNLAVGRLEGTNAVVRVFSARSGEAKSGGLALSGCRIMCADGKEEDVGHANLAISSGRLRLVWAGGEMDVF